MAPLEPLWRVPLAAACELRRRIRLIPDGPLIPLVVTGALVFWAIWLVL